MNDKPFFYRQRPAPRVQAPDNKPASEPPEQTTSSAANGPLRTGDSPASPDLAPESNDCASERAKADRLPSPLDVPRPDRTRKTRRRVGDYKVGYCKPDPKYQFQKGAPSRNPNGRPKGAKNHHTIVIKALDTKVAVREGNKSKRMTKFEVGVTKLVNKFAETGDLRAFKHILDLLPDRGEPNSANGAEPTTADSPQDKARLDAMLKFTEDLIRSGGSLSSEQDEPSSEMNLDDDSDDQGE
jgi:hypothetical protein